MHKPVWVGLEKISPRGENLVWRSWWKFSSLLFHRLIVVNRKYCRMSTRTSTLLRKSCFEKFIIIFFCFPFQRQPFFLSWFNTLKNVLSQKVLNFLCQLLTPNEIPFSKLSPLPFSTPLTRTTQLENLFSNREQTDRDRSEEWENFLFLQPESISNNKFMLY